MPSREDKDLLTRAGRGTPLGEQMRRYWIRAAFSRQFARPDSPPIRVRLVGSDLALVQIRQHLSPATPVAAQ